MIIDTHSHLQFDAYDLDRKEVIRKNQAEGIVAINVGTDLVTSQGAVDLAQNYENMYAAIGLHPTDTNEDLDLEKYRVLAVSKKVVAIGEIGLDYFRKPSDAEKTRQRQIFIQQLDLAKELNLPVILHCRMAHDEVIDILNSKFEIRNSKLRGVVHCFTGTLEQARKYIDLGFYLGIGGIIFKFNIDQVIKNAPLDKLLLETDCPFLTPPLAPEKRNEPIFVKYTIEKIAELRNITALEVAKKTTQNAINIFNI